MQETWAQSLDQEDPLEKGMATHSSIFACRIPWTEEPGGLQSMGHEELDTTERLTLSLLYNVALVPAVRCPESAMCLHLSPLFECPSHLSHHRASSRVPYALQQVLICYLFYT